MLQHGWLFLLKGGWVMWPLFLCAVVSVTVMIERGVTLWRASANHAALLQLVRGHLQGGRRAEALRACQSTPGPVAAMLAAGLTLPASSEHSTIECAMEEVALREIPLLQKRLGILDTVITLSPLLGLLGTITGMIRSFQVVAIASGSDAGFAITGGVAEALIATATGLSIAIMTLPVYNHFNERVRDLISEMEVRAAELLTIVDKLQTKRAATEEAAHATTPA
ncbi:MAG TPA: MotA/TolQ/ExbB proton channel family protein [Armatimonadota bacterium]|jgi:biopolymer transport protein ExbB